MRRAPPPPWLHVRETAAGGGEHSKKSGSSQLARPGMAPSPNNDIGGRKGHSHNESCTHTHKKKMLTVRVGKRGKSRDFLC